MQFSLGASEHGGMFDALIGKVIGIQKFEEFSFSYDHIS
jgi:hypothetical protein